ncbi:MAG: type II toxin-antitoxin system HicB family antitoxin [bacterium]|nr:type II toxin-antitoxin system HicB family antitoxin [bacterium]
MRKVKNIYHKLSALVWQEGGIYVAKGIEVEVASQGSTKKEALQNLQEALELYFENEPQLNISSSFHDISLEKVDIQYA